MRLTKVEKIFTSVSITLIMDDKEKRCVPPLSPTPVPLNVMDIAMGTDHLKHKKL